MVNKQKYSSTIKARPLFYVETKKLSRLVLKGFNEVELLQKVVDENIFQVKTPRRRREIASTISSRLKVLDHFLLEKIITANLETGKVLVLYAILKTDRLFYEFMNEVFYEKHLVMDMFLTDRDFSSFFETKRQQSETVDNWREYTFYKLTQVFIRILFEAGLIKNQKGSREIIRPTIDFDVKNHLTEIGDSHYVAILAGE